MARTNTVRTALALFLAPALAPAFSGVACAQAGGTPAPAQAGSAQTGPAQSGSAQSGSAQAGPATDTTAVFDTAFFAPYNPINASDMVARVPGFEINDGDDRRGFGATAGNVLINGERPSSKAGISEQLRRIPASAVLRIELLSGSASGVDVRGQSRLVNVILRPTADTGSPLNWVLGARLFQYSDRISHVVQLSKSFKLADNIDLSLDLQTPNGPGRSESIEAVRGPSGDLTRYRQQYTQLRFSGIQGAASLKWRLSEADRLNFNLLYNVSDNSTGLGNVEFLPTGVRASSTFGRTEFPTQTRGELGGDWEHTLGPGLNIKLIGLSTFSSFEQAQTLSTYLATGLSNTRRQLSRTDNGERVARAVLTWKANDAHSLEFGAEGAFNFRDSGLSISNQAPGGAVVPVALSVANTRVEELRGEASVTDIWQVAPGFTLETGLSVEASRITQTGDESKQREFTYAKPSLAATWRPEPGSTVRASIRRDVSQLDFGEFATSVNPIDNITLVGNPDLTPEQAWKGRIEWDRRFGPRGALTAGLFYDRVESVRDLIVRDIDPGPAVRLADAIGNLDSGTRTGIDLRGSVPLDFLGLSGTDFRFSTIYQQTRVTDPLTGEERSFSTGESSGGGSGGGGSGRSSGGSGGVPQLNVGNRDWGYVFTLRQELAALKSSWSLSLARNAGREEYKLLESIMTDRAGDRVDLTWETTAIPGVTTRLSVGNIFSPKEERVRTFYTPNRASGVVSRTETRTQKGGFEGSRGISVQMSGKF